MRRGGALALVLVLLLGCGPARQGDGEASTAPPVKPRGTVVLEPPRIEIGDTAELEVAVVTPPGWQAAPLPPVEPPDGLSLLRVGSLKVERRPDRWIQRTPLRVRALRTGSFRWPAMQVSITRPDGSQVEVEIPERPIRVTALLPGSGPPEHFFSYRRLRPEGGPWPGWPTLVLLLVGLAAAAVLLVASRRLRAGRAPAATRPADAPLRDPTGQLRAAIEAAEQLAEREPVAAADALSDAIRRTVAGRFGAPTLVATTEELAVTRPPFALTTRWKRIVAFLRRLDGVRFAAPGPGSDRREIEHVIAEARALAEELRPRGGVS